MHSFGFGPIIQVWLRLFSTRWSARKMMGLLLRIFETEESLFHGILF
jgi:hypothetical protein